MYCLWVISARNNIATASMKHFELKNLDLIAKKKRMRLIPMGVEDGGNGK